MKAAYSTSYNVVYAIVFGDCEPPLYYVGDILPDFVYPYSENAIQKAMELNTKVNYGTTRMYPFHVIEVHVLPRPTRTKF